MSVVAIAYIYALYIFEGPIPVAARSKAWFCGRLLLGIADSSPAGGNVYVSLVNVVCCRVDISVSV